MKKFVLLVLIAALAGGLSFGISRHMRHSHMDELDWMRMEFALNDQQLASIRTLQETYRPVCDEHCARIAVQQSLVSQTKDGTAEHTRALAEMEALEKLCRESTLAHLHQVAAVMPPAQAQRFLAMIEPRLDQHDHQSPMDLH